jgi:hypothetical protein
VHAVANAYVGHACCKLLQPTACAQRYMYPKQTEMSLPEAPRPPLATVNSVKVEGASTCKSCLLGASRATQRMAGTRNSCHRISEIPSSLQALARNGPSLTARKLATAVVCRAGLQCWWMAHRDAHKDGPTALWEMAGMSCSPRVGEETCNRLGAHHGSMGP